MNAATQSPSAPTTPAVPAWPAAVLGALLGLAIWKLGNPVILEDQIGRPTNPDEWWSQPWPTGTGRWWFLALALAMVPLPGVWRHLRDGLRPRWLWLLPLAWLGWQAVSGSATVDAKLTAATLPHLATVVVAFALGVTCARLRPLPLLVGVGLASAVCWLKAVNQRTVEFPRDREALVQGEQSGWTNFTPSQVSEMRSSGFIIRTNNLDVANPAILDKLTRARVHGTLVYPNALAGLVLLAFPVAFGALMPLMDGARPLVRWAALGLLPGLAGASLWWSGSRSGWLLALASGVAVAWLVPAFRRWRTPLTLAVVVGGLGIFVARNAGYLGNGATSASARLDYWKAAVQATAERPLLGHGPGTFMRPYARLKAPESEMARLVHNDYLEQFSDSGVPGGLAYLGWIGAALWLAWTRHRDGQEPWRTGLLVGTTAWLAQGVAEFGLYVPALSWTGFVFLGWLVSETGELPSTPRAGGSKTARATS
jgi:hypothetical protein